MDPYDLANVLFNMFQSKHSVPVLFKIVMAKSYMYLQLQHFGAQPWYPIVLSMKGRFHNRQFWNFGRRTSNDRLFFQHCTSIWPPKVTVVVHKGIKWLWWHLICAELTCLEGEDLLLMLHALYQYAEYILHVHCVVPENIHNPPMEGFLNWTPTPLEIPFWCHTFVKKNWVFEIPLPLGISINLPWGGHGYFRELHVHITVI